MSSNKNIKATKLLIELPFNLGTLEFENDDLQRRTAWEIYVELSTRLATQRISENEGILRETLSSLYKLFDVIRQVLRDAGPDIAANGSKSLGPLSINILNIGLRPFLSKWHPRLLEYEQQKPLTTTSIEHEREWCNRKEFIDELEQVRCQMNIYLNALAKIAGVE